MTRDALKGWQPDPFGRHEFRFFSDDGKPTMLVSDGHRKFHDHPPSTVRMQSTEPIAETIRPQPSAEATVDGQQILLESNGRAVDSISVPLKIAYGVVIALVVVSALALAIVHLDAKGPKSSSHSATSLTAPPTTTLAIPPKLSQSAVAAAAALVSSWANSDRASALTVATESAVATLFAAPYSSGLVIDRGCSDAFSPIVCTYGPEGGASPTDPIYEIYVSKTPEGWYVSSTKIEN
jgi:hypothetical protein